MSESPKQIPPFHTPDALFASLLASDAAPIGTGTSRDAFAIDGHLDKVLKVAKGSNAGNWTEFVVFHALDNNTLFGRILSISQSGKYLVMERLDDVPKGLQLPEVPSWWTDRKRANFGLSCNKTIKLRDYALITIGTGALVPMPSSDDVADMARLISLMSQKR